ncbi:MAG: hypothetical protein WC120_00560 [Parcubacteria group bacterium]
MATSSLLRPYLKRAQCHIIVLVPAMEDARSENYPDWPNYPTRAYPLYQKSVGEKKDWPHPFDEIAMCKALQLWTDRNDDRTMPIPHLLFPGDTPYWGGVKRRGIVVTCSGVQPWFDKMISGVIADVIVGLAHNAYENDEERKSGVNFLS